MTHSFQKPFTKVRSFNHMGVPTVVSGVFLPGRSFDPPNNPDRPISLSYGIYLKPKS